MLQINEHFAELAGNYLFAGIARKVKEFQSQHPQADVIRMGIGDVTLPLAPAILEAMHRAVDEMSDSSSFRGYGPEQGYEFLREAIVKHDYLVRGIKLDIDEVFVSDGSKCDVANIQELFSVNSTVAIGDPVYPVYRDSNILAGRGKLMHFMPCRRENNFNPELPSSPVELIYLCSPNNPTGTAMGREELTRFVDYARKTGAVILFDGAYEAYIQDQDLPHSIYEIEGAEEVAIEFRSFSKNAGFTGTRCAYTVVPKALPGKLNDLWRRRQTTKFNGVSYIIQRGAEAVYTEPGQRQIRAQIAYYMENARIIRRNLAEMGYSIYGGANAPYLWWQIPNAMPSEKFFDALLENCHVVGTPGAGFGTYGEGYFRLTAFGNRERTLEALERIRTWKIS